MVVLRDLNGYVIVERNHKYPWWIIRQSDRWIYGRFSKKRPAQRVLWRGRTGVNLYDPQIDILEALEAETEKPGMLESGFIQFIAKQLTPFLMN